MDGIEAKIFDTAQRSAVPDDEILAVLRAAVPGGSSVSAWLPQKDGWTSHETAIQIVRSAIHCLNVHRGAKHGYVYNGPDGEWHWAAKPDRHESVTEQRPATALERALLTAAR